MRAQFKKVNMKTYSRKNSSYLKKAFIASNFNEMCRLCLSEVDMVLTPIIQDCKTSYQEWIHYSVDVLIEEGDGLPPNICEECLAMIEQTYLFKKKCKASDSKLREHLELMEEGKLNETSFIEESEDHKNLFMKEYPSESKCDESSAVDSGGTDIQENSECHNKITVNETTKKNTEPQNQKILMEEKNNSEEKIINKIQRYILKGEIREGDQEEDLSVCEVVPLDSKNEESVANNLEAFISTKTDCFDQNGHFVGSQCSNNSESLEKSGRRIQEIYQLWDNEEDGEETQEVEKSKDVVMFDVVWDKELNEDKKNVKMDDKEENEVIQMHRIYTNKNRIKIIETIPEARTFQCPQCNENFPKSTDLKEHLRKIHSEFSDIAFCEICCKSFTCTNSLKRHMTVHTGAKPYNCKICGRNFSQGSILKRHILTHESLKPFNCHICNKGYTQKINLLSHLKIHGFRTGVESFRCKLCSKSFVHQSGLSRHVKMHKGVRFLCVDCEKSFVDGSALTRHLKVVHQH